MKNIKNISYCVNMFRTLRTVLNNIKIYDDPKPLGRWAHHCEISNNIKSTLANHDCCGDDLCGDPLKVKHILAKERVKLVSNIK